MEAQTKQQQRFKRTRGGEGRRGKPARESAGSAEEEGGR